MSQILARDYDTGIDGQSATGEFDVTYGNGGVLTYQASAAVGAGVGVRAVSSATFVQGRHNFASAPALAWMSVYFTISAYPSAAVTFWQWYLDLAVVGGLRINPSGTVILRDATSTGATSTNPLAIGLNRIDVLCQPGVATNGHQAYFYQGANVHSLTAIESLQANATQAGLSSLDSLRLGEIGSSSWDFAWDRVRADNAARPAAYVAPSAPVAGDLIIARSPG